MGDGGSSEVTDRTRNLGATCGGSIAAAGAEAASGGGPLAGRRLLIADDEPTILESLRSILAGLGAVVDVARDGRQAVEMALAAPYALVISDIRMPYKNGYEVFRDIRAARPRTAIILMTAFGYDPSHAIVRAGEEGLRAVLLKPFKMQMLFDQINQALGTELRMPSRTLGVQG